MGTKRERRRLVVLSPVPRPSLIDEFRRYGAGLTIIEMRSRCPKEVKDLNHWSLPSYQNPKPRCSNCSFGVICGQNTL